MEPFTPNSFLQQQLDHHNNAIARYQNELQQHLALKTMLESMLTQFPAPVLLLHSWITSMVHGFFKAEIECLVLMYRLKKEIKWLSNDRSLPE